MVSLKFASRTCALGLSAFTLACLGPNPLLDAGEEASTTEESGDGDGDATTGDGDGDGDAEGDGDGEPASCSNGQQDADETDIDCGGSCGPCDDGSACVEQTDCASQVCADLICQAPSCDDDVQNGDEIGVDCGGAACGFCEYGSFAAELDDFEGSAASHPRAAMFPDGSFALTYNGPMEARARWYDEFGAPLAASVEVSANITFAGNLPIPVHVGEGDDYPIHVLETGVNGTNEDLFLVRLTQAGSDFEFQVALNQAMVGGDLTVDGNLATIAWEQSNNIVIRRFDYTLGDGGWSDVAPLDAEDMQNNFDGQVVALARNAAGTRAAAWFRTSEGGGEPWNVVVRRFGNGWETDPVAAEFPNGETPLEPRVAIADDGRVAVIARLYDLEQSGIGAWILDADLVPEGPPWVLQTGISHAAGLPAGDVAALSDGSFVFAWPDPGQARVHLRRFVGPNEAKLPEIGDESPWLNVNSPASVSLAGIDGRLLVVWSAMVDGVRQIQGQVLSY